MTKKIKPRMSRVFVCMQNTCVIVVQGNKSVLAVRTGALMSCDTACDGIKVQNEGFTRRQLRPITSTEPPLSQ